MYQSSDQGTLTLTTQSSRTQATVPLGIRRLGTLLGAVLVLLLPAACVLIPQARDPSAALGTEVRWREGRSTRISRSVGVWVDANSQQIMGAVLERPSAPLDRSETIRPESIIRLSDTPASAPKVVTMGPDSPRFDDPGRFFVTWLQNGSVFRQLCKLNNMHPLSSSLIPTRVTEGTVNVVNYDLASSPIDAAVVLASADFHGRIAVQRISFDAAVSDSMRVEELLPPRSTSLLVRSNGSLAGITISSVSDAASSSLEVRHLVAWPETRKIKFLLLGADV